MQFVLLNRNMTMFISLRMVLWCLCLITYIVCVPILLDRAPPPSYTNYAYTSLAAKVHETLSQSKCTYSIQSKPSYNVTCSRDVIITPVSLPSPPSTTSYIHYSRHMCSLTRFRQTRLHRGCLHSPARVEHIGHLHPLHPRCTVPSSLCPESFQVAPPLSYVPPFLLHTSLAIVSRSGFLVKPCGYVALRASCKVDDDAFAIASAAAMEHQTCFSSQCDLPTYNRVFVATQYDDTQIGQFLLESFPKILVHLPYLLANPDIYIHYGYSRTSSHSSKLLSYHYFEAVGLSRLRIITDNVFASAVLMPREGGCQDPGYNAAELHHMRSMMLRPTTMPTIGRKRIVLLQRGHSSFSQNLFDVKRRWSDSTISQLHHHVQLQWSDYEIVVFSDTNRTLMKCIECQVEIFQYADIVIGVHGAGLVNTMYMPQGSIIVEAIPYDYFDSRHIPITGIFSRLAGVFGLHHYTYISPTEEWNMAGLVKEAAAFVVKCRSKQV